MSKYNIYRLLPEKKKSLLSKLETCGLKPQLDNKIDGFSLQLFFSQAPDERPVPWLKLYKDFLDSTDEIKSIAYFAVLLISKGNDILYAVSLGKSHFYLQEFCDLDFGIDIGQRLIDENYVHNKNSKLFGGKKKKSLIIYKADTKIDLESGESIVYLKGRTIKKEKWGKNLICGSSALFSIQDLKPERLPSLIEAIEEKLKEKPLFNIPRAEAILKNDDIKLLDKKLIGEIKKNKDELEIDEQMLSGIEFIFSKDYHFLIRLGDSKWFEFDNPNALTLMKLIAENNFDLSEETIEQIKIKATPDEGAPFIKNIRYFLDYVDNDNYFLNNGKWFRLNQKYVEYLHSELDKIDWKEFSAFTYKKSQHDLYLCNFQKEEDKRKWYAERYFNSKVAGEKGYMVLDRELDLIEDYKIEEADLYFQGTLFFVKIGNLQKTNYVFQQCLGSLRKLLDQKRKIEINGTQYDIKSLCIWVILDRKTKIKNLKELKSFLFLMGLVNCCKEIRMSGLIPDFRISYKGD